MSIIPMIIFLSVFFIDEYKGLLGFITILIFRKKFFICSLTFFIKLSFFILGWWVLLAYLEPEIVQPAVQIFIDNTIFIIHLRSNPFLILMRLITIALVTFPESFPYILFAGYLMIIMGYFSNWLRFFQFADIWILIPVIVNLILLFFLWVPWTRIAGLFLL